jgi:hypothetical protein
MSGRGCVMRWEYKIIFFISEPLDDDVQYESRLHEGVHILNDMGADGWELVQFLDHQVSKNVMKYHAILKRPVSG